jgi:lipopolysaccharide export system permease protein
VILDSSFRREAARTFGATLVVLLTIVLTWVLIRVLTQSGRGQIDPQDVALFIGLYLISQLGTLMAITLFITVMAVLTRWFRESEMAVWQSSGIGVYGLLKPVLRFSWPFVIAILGLTLLVWPWANQQQAELKEVYEKRSDVARAAPGQFRESADGRRVFFFEGNSDVKSLVGNAENLNANSDEKSANPIAQDARGASRVFVRTIENNGAESVTLASSGGVKRLKENNLEGIFIELLQGRRYEFSSVPKIQTRISEFARYLVKIKDDDNAVATGPAPNAMPPLTLAITDTPAARGELFWRLSVPLCALLLSLLAVPLAATQPRAGKGLHFLMATLTFLIYFNFINLGLGWISQGRTVLPAMMVALHGTALVLFISLMWRKSSGWTLSNSVTRLLSRKRSFA